MSNSRQRIDELYRTRPRSLFLRLNSVAVIALAVVAWWQLNAEWSEFWSPRRLENLQRFARDIYPFALRDKPFALTEAWAWLANIWSERGAAAVAATFHISAVAMILAGGSAVLLVFMASRNVASPEPFLPSGTIPSRRQRWMWGTVVAASRGLFIFARSIPEYVWAFLLIAMLGPSAWPAILALAVHNFGILGKLGAEVVENQDDSSAAALRGAGLSRRQIAMISLLPASLGKWLLFFFYRWESCIREATILGMLGIASLGYEITDARARDWHDEMLVFILLSATLVLVVDVLSAVTRRYLRQA